MKLTRRSFLQGIATAVLLSTTRIYLPGREELYCPEVDGQWESVDDCIMLFEGDANHWRAYDPGTGQYLTEKREGNPLELSPEERVALIDEANENKPVFAENEHARATTKFLRAEIESGYQATEEVAEYLAQCEGLEQARRDAGLA